MLKTTEAPTKAEWVPTHCSMCYHGCPILVHVQDGVATKIEGNPTSPTTQGAICPKGNVGIMRLYDPNRVKKPMIRTNPEKGLDVDPGWKEIGWDEAKDILFEKLKAVREDNPTKLGIGGYNPHSWMWSVAFGIAFGTHNAARLGFSSMGHMCGNGSHIAGGMIQNAMNSHPDLEYAEYVIIVGAALTEAYQGAVGYMRQLADKREAGNFKLVVVDPQQSRAAQKAEEWVPIRPATDGAMIFGMMHALLLENGVYDKEYLQKYTNAGYLIQPDGHYARHPESKTPLVWDEQAGAPVEQDSPSLDQKNIALTGTYEVNGVQCRPGFDLFKEKLAQYTPEWAESVCSVPAATIRRIATEFGEAAHIGETIEIDGKTYPYRPVSVAGYRGLAAHSNGMHSAWAAEMMNLLVGSTRSVGGLRAWETAMRPAAPKSLNPGQDGLVAYEFPEGEFSFPAESVTLTEYFPLSFTPGLACYDAQLEPEKYGIANPVDLLLFDAGNPVMTAQNPQIIMDALRKIPYFVDMTIYLDETAQFADMVLPDTTYLERWEWEGSWMLDDEGLTVQRPVVEPLYGIESSANIFIELAQRLDIQKGPRGFTSMLNVLQHGDTPAYDITHEYKNSEEYVRAYVHHFAGDEEDLVWKQGHNHHKISPTKRYIPDCLDNLRMPFYQAWFIDVKDRLETKMEAHKVFEKTGLDRDRIYFEYTGLPFWHQSVIETEPSEYDMYVINWRTPMGAVCAGTLPASNAWLMEIAERDPYFCYIQMNTKAAHAKGLEDGDFICVESPHGKMTGILKCTETIHPEVIGTQGLFGHKTKGAAKGKRLPGHFNSLLGSGIKYMGPSSLQAETAAKAKVYKIKERFWN